MPYTEPPMKLLPFYLLALLGTQAHAASFGVGLHFNDRSAHHDSWYRPIDTRYERHSHLGFEIVTPRPHRSYHRDPHWRDLRDDDDFVATWPLTREPRFEFRTEPRRPAPKVVQAPAPAPVPELATEVEEIEETELTGSSEPVPPSPESPILHYCASARAYYPAVRSCPGGWERQKGVKLQ